MSHPDLTPPAGPRALTMVAFDARLAALEHQRAEDFATIRTALDTIKVVADQVAKNNLLMLASIGELARALMALERP